ncbi:MAG TPA: hypothetical protein PLR28_11200 [Dokdonella sp.]|nr:hypothetical protein [Dokdonella sp.]
MSTIRALALFACVAALALVAGCASRDPRPDANYAAYLDLVRTQQGAQDALITGIAAAASACTDSRCVEHVASVAALAAAGGGNRAPPQMHRAEPSLGRQVALALVGQIAPLASAAVNWHQSDNARKTSEAQYAYMGSVLSAAVGGMASVASNATPSVTVGGNYGDTYGDNYTGRDRTDVAGPLINGDGNIVGDRNYNSGRQDSAGPYDRLCSGDSCQPASAPEPTPGDP